MHRPDHITADPNAIAFDVPGYTEGNPGAAIPRTIVTKEAINDLTESLCRVVEGAGKALVKLDYDQLTESIIRHAAREAERRSILSLVKQALTTGTTYKLTGIAADGIGNVTAVGHTLGGACYAQDSADHGATWTQNSLGGTIDEVVAVAYGAGYFVAIGYDVGATQLGCVYRPVGGAWSAFQAISAASYGFRGRAVAYNGTQWVVVGVDALTWYTAATPPSSGWTNVSASNGTTLDLNVVVSDGTTTLAAGKGSSGLSDGRTTRTDDVASGPWSVAAIPQLESANEVISAATDGSGRWVFGLEFGYIAATSDFVTWDRTNFGAANITAMTRTTEHFVLVNAVGDIAVSVDGKAWTDARDMAVTSFAGLAAADVLYVCGAAGTDKVAFRSGYAR